ncbi:MAG: hypothetical protein Q9174_003074 [Haloplaca sp. 1 TL-2023]
MRARCLLIVFSSHIIISACLPTITVPDTSSPFLTQLAGGGLIVPIPETSTRNGPAATLSVPNATTTESETSRSRSATAHSSPGLASLVDVFEMSTSSIIVQTTPMTRMDEVGGILASPTQNAMTPISSSSPSYRALQSTQTPIGRETGSNANASNDEAIIMEESLSLQPNPTVTQAPGSSDSWKIISDGEDGSSLNPWVSGVLGPSSFSTVAISDSSGVLLPGTDGNGAFGGAPLSIPSKGKEFEGESQKALVSTGQSRLPSTDVGKMMPDVQETSINSLLRPAQTSANDDAPPIGSPGSTSASFTRTEPVAGLVNGMPNQSIPPVPANPQLPAVAVPSNREQVKPQEPTLPNSVLPTATQTTAPSGFSLKVETNIAWTSDTTIVTNLPGKAEPTEVPVFTNCDGCGPGGSLVLLGAFKPGISYNNLPKLPGLPSPPSFHMPCILLCNSPGGGKPGPPVRETGGSSHDTNDDQNNDDDNGDQDNNDDQDDQDDDEEENEEDEEDEDEDEEEDEDEDEDDQQSTDSPTSQPTSTMISSPSVSSSQSPSSSTGVTGSVMTATALIDERSTDPQVPDEGVQQYLMAAYSRLGYLEEGDVDMSGPAATSAATSATPGSSLIDIFPTTSSVGSKTFARAIRPSSLTPGIIAKPSSTLSSTASSSVAPSSTTEEASEETTPIDDEIECTDIGGNIWIERDQAVTGAYEYCNQDDMEKELFEGTDDHIKFSLVDNGHPVPYNPDLPGWLSCYLTFTELIDHCQANHPASNPHNYKFGGTNTTKAGLVYHWEPLAAKEIDQRCDITWNGLFNVFEIRGKWFPDDLFGEDGSGLRREIEGCGAVTRWSFKWTPDDVEYQWYATGRYCIVKKGCLGRAIESAGGSGGGSC